MIRNTVIAIAGGLDQRNFPYIIHGLIPEAIIRGNLGGTSSGWCNIDTIGFVGGIGDYSEVISVVRTKVHSACRCIG